MICQWQVFFVKLYFAFGSPGFHSMSRPVFQQLISFPPIMTPVSACFEISYKCVNLPKMLR